MPSPNDLDMFSSDLDFNPIPSVGLQTNAPLDGYTFTSPEPSGDIYADLNGGNEIPLDEAYSDIDTGNYETHMDDIFNLESSSPDMSLALSDPELQPLLHAPDCDKFKSVLCCNPKKEFIPAAVDECIWCMNTADFAFSPPPPFFL